VNPIHGLELLLIPSRIWLGFGGLSERQASKLLGNKEGIEKILLGRKFSCVKAVGTTKTASTKLFK